MGIVVFGFFLNVANIDLQQMFNYLLIFSFSQLKHWTNTFSSRSVFIPCSYNFIETRVKSLSGEHSGALLSQNSGLVGFPMNPDE